MSSNESYSAAAGGSRKRIKTSRTGRRDVSNDPASPTMAVISEMPITIDGGSCGGVSLPKIEAQQERQNSDHVHNGICRHEQTLQTLHTDMDAMRQLITCKMCYRFLYEPYGLSCGHTYCYSCLAQWMGNSKTCPDCRATVKEQPTPTFVIREMVRVFTAKSELLPEGETSAEHEKMAREEAEIVAKDKANLDVETGGLFRGRFRQGSRYHPVPAIRDEGDNVWRCPSCMVEVEDGRCRVCNMRVHIHGDTDNDSMTTDDDDDEDLDAALEDMDHDHDVDLGLDARDVFGSEGFDDGSSDIDDDLYRHPIHHLDGGPPNHRMQHIFESEDESEGSMDGFIDEEVHFEDDATIDESDDEAESTPARPSGSQQRRRPVLSDSDDDDDDEDDVEETSGPRRRVVPHYQRFENTSSAIADRNTDDEDESEDVPISSNNARRPRTITIDSDDEDSSSDAPPEEGHVDFSQYGDFSPVTAQIPDSDLVNPASEHQLGDYDRTNDSAEEHSSDETHDDDDDDAFGGPPTSRPMPSYEPYDDEDEEEQDSDDSDEQSMTNGFYV